MTLRRTEILNWLRETDPARLESLWQEADRVRKNHVGDEVHLRGLIEISSFCRRSCLYCGIRRQRNLERYRMSEHEILACAHRAVRLGYGTVVLQSGEDSELTCDSVARTVRRIKVETPLAVTLSLGERGLGELAAWREAGADRYLLKHETSDAELFRRIHPVRDMTETSDIPGSPNQRIELLRQARALGYEIGSGVMVGIPGQTFESLADDIMLFRDLDLDMIGCGPFVPHPDTPLGRGAGADPVRRGGTEPLTESLQVPPTDLMTTKVVALTRLVCPDANIPSTTALATVNREHGRELGLQRGANVWMPNLTPPRYRVRYDIYPGKAAVNDDVERYHESLLSVIAALGRRPGKGPGSRLHLPDAV